MCLSLCCLAIFSLGKHIDFVKHVRLEFGAYVQTHEQHTNDMTACTIGAICLGPSGNEQGGHYFLSLATGKRVHCHHWTPLSMPQDAIARVNAIALRQSMPKTITFSDRFGMEYPDDSSEIDDDHDSTYNPEADTSDSTTVDDNSEDSTATKDFPDTDSQNNDDNHDDADDYASVISHESTGVDNINDINNDTMDDNTDEAANPGAEQDDIDVVDDEGSTDKTTEYLEPNNINNDDESADDSLTETSGDENSSNVRLPEIAEIPGVGNPGVRDEDHSVQQEMDQRYGQQQHGIGLCSQRQPKYDHQSKWTRPSDWNGPHDGAIFLTKQMSLKRGLKEFGKAGANSVIEELRWCYCK